MRNKSMSETSPNAVPGWESAVGVSPSPLDKAALDRIASGQRLMIFGLLAMLLYGLLKAILGPAAANPAFGELIILFAVAIIALGAVIGGLVGQLRLAKGLGYSRLRRLVCVLLMLLPFINFLVAVLSSSQATNALRAGGYQVGLFGANESEPGLGEKGHASPTWGETGHPALPAMQRPWHVSAAVALIGLSTALDLAVNWQKSFGGGGVDLSPSALAWIAVLTAFVAALCVFIHRGRTWARVVYLTFYVGAVLVTVVTAGKQGLSGTIEQAVSMTGFVMEAVAVYLLFTTPGSLWLRRKR